jgi:hypothetical protein
VPFHCVSASSMEKTIEIYSVKYIGESTDHKTIKERVDQLACIYELLVSSNKSGKPRVAVLR